MFDIHQIAVLSRLRISPEQEKSFEAQVKEILSYVETLQKVDTSSIQGYGLTDAESVWREDVAASGSGKGERVGLAPSSRDGMFLVPKVLGGGGESS